MLGLTFGKSAESDVSVSVGKLVRTVNKRLKINLSHIV